MRRTCERILYVECCFGNAQVVGTVCRLRHPDDHIATNRSLAFTDLPPRSDSCSQAFLAYRRIPSPIFSGACLPVKWSSLQQTWLSENHLFGSVWYSENVFLWGVPSFHEDVSGSVGSTSWSLSHSFRAGFAKRTHSTARTRTSVPRCRMGLPGVSYEAAR